MIDKSWNIILDNFDIKIDESHTVFPEKDNRFRVFQMPVSKIRVVILGQDPYHNDGQADGLAFSVPKTEKIPPSLRNIFKELLNEFPERGYKFEHGDLSEWFEREKIFLLNTALTVEKNKPGSHCASWCQMTDAVIKHIAEKNKKCIFLLLGKHAQEKEKLIADKSRIVKCVHPSPLSASKGFFNSGIFQEVETKLKKEINWQN